jgi:hypothetical protein
VSIIVRGTETGFELQLQVRWRLLVGFIRSLFATLAALAVLLSTPIGRAILAWFGW